MKDIFRILLISLLSFTIISCSKKDESESSRSSNIQLSDVNANLSGKSLFITTGDSSSSSSRSSRSSNKTSSTSTDSLITIDNNSVIEYGIISDYDLEIEQIKIDPTNTYAYMLLKYTENREIVSDLNIMALNCTLFQIRLSNNEIKCIESGLSVDSIYHNMIYGVNDYHLENFQFGSSSNIFFRTSKNDFLNSDENLTCSKSCIFKHDLNTNTTSRISSNSWEGERFVSLGDGSIIWSGLELDGSKATEILHIDQSGTSRELTSNSSGQFNGDFRAGDFLTGFWGSESHQTTTFVRVENNTIRKTYITHDLGHSIVIKGYDGETEKGY